MKEYKDFYIPAAILFSGLFIGGAILYNTGMGEGMFDSVRGTAALVERTPSDAVDNNGSTATFTIGENDHVKGDFNAPITIVEFSDLECPFCKRFHATMQQALQEYSGKVRWVYKHFPLDGLHPQARPAAEASECVAEQKGDDGFWQFVDAMFENQSRLGNALYEEIAQQIGVNLSQFQTCVSERTYQDKVAQDYQQGLKAGVTGTPGSFVNGVPIKGAVPYSQLQSIIDSQL